MTYASLGVAGAMLGSRRLGMPLQARALVADAVPVTPTLSILPRDSWGASTPPRGVPPAEDDVRFLLVHHTAGDTNHTQDDVPGILRQYFGFHTGPDKGWPDIAYNFLIDRYGRVWEGRTGSLQGAVAADATGGNQGHSQLVCLIGDFTSAPPTEEARAAAVETLAWLADRHGIDTTPGARTSFVSRGSNRWPKGSTIETPTVAGHRDMSLTACPGDAFYPIVRDEFQALVSARRQTSPPATRPAPSTTSPPPPSIEPPATTTAAPVTPPPPPTTAAAPTAATAASSTFATSTTIPSATSHTDVTNSDDGQNDRKVVVPVSIGAATALVALVVWGRRRRPAPSDPRDPDESVNP